LFKKRLKKKLFLRTVLNQKIFYPKKIGIKNLINTGKFLRAIQKKS